ncbi:MAG: hypothetical protein JKY88_15395 [Pseudomonadales bacterium]|nr:hypothetical protein [Pseudomonadales bacterium]
MIEKTRKCPKCEHGTLSLSDLPMGAECSYCHKQIEIDFFYSAGIPILLAVLVTLFYKYDYGILGHASVLSLVIFTAGYKSVFTAYLPLKDYAGK